jgi:RimJ/RimL family protein N-acetyltransferase
MDGESNEPLGPLVDATPAPRPERITLNGSSVTLVPLDPAAHARDLFDAVRGADHLWTYLFYGPFAEYASFRVHMDGLAASTDPLFFAIVDNTSGRAVGRAALMRIEPAHRVIEVGHVLYSPALQRTRGATEAMFLLARYVFDDLGYRRYEWKCDALNGASRAAALRLGFTDEGTFRQHLIVKGRNRDTAWFSMLDVEWPKRKRAFERWLSPANFDAGGRQLSPLGRD